MAQKMECAVPDLCHGWNQSVKNGHFNVCGFMSPFSNFYEVIPKKHYLQKVQTFMDHYEIEPFTIPKGLVNERKARNILNKFYMAKYGLFTCMDAGPKWGQYNANRDLVRTFETETASKRTWNLAIMICIREGAIRWDELKPYKKEYTQGREYLEASARVRKERKGRSERFH